LAHYHFPSSEYRQDEKKYLVLAMDESDWIQKILPIKNTFEEKKGELIQAALNVLGQ
jgi:hypothetical protein